MTPEFEAKYRALNEKYHVAWNEKSPMNVNVLNVEALRRLYEQDEHLNNISLRQWDSLAISFLAQHRNCGLSLAEAVCMQKQAARDLLLRTEKEVSNG